MSNVVGKTFGATFVECRINLDAVRFGLMEIGFVRFSLLRRDQRQSVLTQERANFVILSNGTRAENIDPIVIPEQYRESQASAEEEAAADDEVEGSPGGLATLLDNLRRDQNIALSSKRSTDASQLQQAIMAVLYATAGPEPEGLSMTVATDVRNVCQRLYRWHRNRGSD